MEKPKLIQLVESNDASTRQLGWLFWEQMIDNNWSENIWEVFDYIDSNKDSRYYKAYRGERHYFFSKNVLKLKDWVLAHGQSAK